MSVLRLLHDPARPERATLVLTLAALLGAGAGWLMGPVFVERVLYACATSPERRALALQRLLERGHGRSLLEAAVVEEEGSLHDRALELAVRWPVPDALRARIERPAPPPTLEDLRRAAALADESALPGLIRLLRTTRWRPRQAAFTAFAAVVARERVPRARLPALDWDERRILGELALDLEEDSPPWRADALRALAANLRVTPLVVSRLRAQLRAVGEGDGLVERAVLWLRGDPLALQVLPPDQRERIGLLAPLQALRARADASFLDAVLALDRWGGAGDWRWLEAARPELLAAALARARDRERPAARAAALVLAIARDPRCRVAPAVGDVEDAPPPLLAAFGPEDVPALVLAAGRLDGKLARVLEPGAATPRERLLLDLAVAAFSSQH